MIKRISPVRKLAKRASASRLIIFLPFLINQSDISLFVRIIPTKATKLMICRILNPQDWDVRNGGIHSLISIICIVHAVGHLGADAGDDEDGAQQEKKDDGDGKDL